MADDLSLLFRLKADNAQAKTTIAETRAAVASLKQTLGPELSQSLLSTNKILADVGDHLNGFVGARLPLVGGAFLRVTENLKGFTEELKKGGPHTAALAQQIDSIAKSSGKTSTEVARFLTTFTRLEGQTARNDAAFKFFGGSVDLIGNKTANLLPELEKAGTALAATAEEGAGAASALAGLAGPIGIAVLAIGALAAGAVVAAKEIFDLAKQAAEFQDRIFNLAQQTGLAVETLSALELAARTTGGELGSITQAVVLFQGKLDEAQNPLSKTAEQFRKFNIDTTDTENALRQTFAALARMPEGFAQTNAAAEFFGRRGGKQVLAILKETNGDLDETTKRLRELGILISEDDARAAHLFNEQLILLEFQLRGLGTEAIPVLLDALRSLSGILRDNRDLFTFLQGFIKGLILPLGEVLKVIKNLDIAAGLLTGNLKPLVGLLKEIKENSEIPEIKIPSVAPVPLPSAPDARQLAAQAVDQANAVVAGVKRIVAQQNQSLDELFQKGRKNREQQTEETISLNAKVLEADRQQIDASLDQKKQEILALDEAQRKRGEIVRRDTDDYRAINTEVAKLQQQRLDKENEFNVSSAALREKAAKERADAEREQAQSNTDALTAELDKQVHIIEEANKRRARVEPTTFSDLAERLQQERDDTSVIQLLEQAKIDFRIKGLEQQKQIGQLTVREQQRLNTQINQLNQEADRLAQEHADRRIEIALDEAQRFSGVAQLLTDALGAKVDTALRVGQINDEARIAAIRALADLRVKTEEQSARDILKVRLDALQREKDLSEIALQAFIVQNKAELEAIHARKQAIEIELKKASTIEDKTTRVREQTALQTEQQALADAEIGIAKKTNAEQEKAEAAHNEKIRVLDAERISIEEQGNRDINEKRQEDLQNERRYYDELKKIKEQIGDIERDTAEEVIRLMRLHFAKRKDIIKAQRDLDLADEAARHQRVTDSIRAQQREVDEQIRILEQHLKDLKIGTDAEIAEYERIITELEKLRQKHDELERQQDAEDKRSTTKGKVIEKRATADLEDTDPLSLRSLFGDRFKEQFENFKQAAEEAGKPISDLRANIEALALSSADAFERMSRDTGNFASFASEAFGTLAQGLGQIVESYVLLGETGPAALRKLLAQVLAHLAAEAAVKAIFELAEGFALLFVNPAASAAHFTAAAIYGSVAGVAAVAGRSVAGDLFKQKPSSAGNAGTNQDRGQLNPLTLNRNQPQPPHQPQPQTQRVVVEFRVNDSEFGRAISAHVVKDITQAGPIRETLANDGKF